MRVGSGCYFIAMKTIPIHGDLPEYDVLHRWNTFDLCAQRERYTTVLLTHCIWDETEMVGILPTIFCNHLSVVLWIKFHEDWFTGTIDGKPVLFWRMAWSKVGGNLLSFNQWRPIDLAFIRPGPVGLIFVRHIETVFVSGALICSKCYNLIYD